MKSMRRTPAARFMRSAIANPSEEFCDRCGKLQSKCRCKKR